MSEQSTLKEYQGYIMDKGIAHLVYYMSELTDVIHPFSEKGYELLSDDFVMFLEQQRPIIPEKAPIVLEIVGKPRKKEEKELIDSAIWSHFCLNLASSDKEVKKCTRTMILYLIYTVISSVLLYAVETSTDELLVNLAYIPFWFYGYRMLTFLLLDTPPLWKDRQWYRQLASCKLIFTEEAGTSSVSLDPEAVSEEVMRYEKETDNSTRNNEVVSEYMMDEGIVSVGCTVSSIGDMIQMPQLEGREFLSHAMGAYLEQVEPFLKPNSQIVLNVGGCEFTPKEQSAIQNAVYNYYGLRVAEMEKQSSVNLKKILSFGIFVIASSAAIVFLGQSTDAAWHEFILMGFWFFGDYLLDFLLVERAGIRISKKVLEACRRMKLQF